MGANGNNNTINDFHQRYTLKNGCWIWNTTKIKKYPQWWFDNKQVYVHRWSYEYFNGPIPQGYDVCHHCDNPCCVNPKHLFVGTRQDNINDMVSKNRQCRGSQKPTAKLNENDVIAIRNYPSYYGSNRKLAKKYQVSVGTIEQIKSNKTWRHI